VGRRIQLSVDAALRRSTAVRRVRPGHDCEAMDPKTSARVLVALSIAYGITIGILGIVDSGAIAAVAIIGALVLGGLWVVRGLFLKRGNA
jgi:hypothetical protein